MPNSPIGSPASPPSHHPSPTVSSHAQFGTIKQVRHGFGFLTGHTDRIDRFFHRVDLDPQAWAAVGMPAEALTPGFDLSTVLVNGLVVSFIPVLAEHGPRALRIVLVPSTPVSPITPKD